MRRILSTALLLSASWLHMVPAIAHELRLAVSAGPVSLPVYVAEAKGYFKSEGADVKMLDCRSGRQCVEMLQQGQADVATAAELLVSLNGLAKADLSIVATLSNSHQMRVIARRSAGVSQAQDLKGKRIGTVAGTSAEYYLDTWLLFQGVDRAGVTLVPLPAERIAAAMQSREVDAVAIWEPIASTVADALKDDLATMPTPRVYTQHFALVTGRRKAAAMDAEIVKLLRALARASQLIAKEPAAARQILATQLHISDAQAASHLAAHDYSLNLDQSLVSTMESQARWALRTGQVEKGGSAVNLLRAIDPSLLKIAVPGAVTLVQ